jgi:phage terminase large subunit-like protein
MSREQASLIFNLAVKMLQLNPDLEGLYKVIPSGKRIHGLRKNVEYKALSSDGSTAHGLSPVLALLDEVGQIRGSMTPFVEAITTSQGAYENPLLVMISTQAPSDSDFLSIQIDDALRSGDPHTVCHLYCADPESDLMDEEQWKKSNPALDLFRSKKDLEEQLKQASRVPSMEASARNLLLNQRIALDSLWLAPTVWKECGGLPDLEVFRSGMPVSMGLDLSMRNDLTAVVLASMDDEGVIHLLPFAFTPEEGIRARELQHKVPYTQWIQNGSLIGVPSKSMSYDWLCQFMRIKLEELEIHVTSIEFDRWRIEDLKSSASREGFCQDAEWHEVGQGFRDFSPRIEAFESLLLNGKIRHGSHPVLNMGK